MRAFFVAVALVVCVTIHAAAEPVGPLYKAATTIHTAVVFPPPAGQRPDSFWAQDVIAANLKYYENLTIEATAKGAQIIVFPESGTGYLATGDDANAQYFAEAIPTPGFKASRQDCLPSTVFGSHAIWASCAAQRYGLDIVINYCGQDGTDGSGGAYYNVDTAFNKAGYALATYKKSHINSVPALAQPKRPDPVTFESSFGVLFGMFTCYDLWFASPLDDLQFLYGVFDYVYPNGMSSLAPLAAMDQIHAGFSMQRTANLLSSALLPAGGAGVFNSGEARELNYLHPFANASSNVIVTEVYQSPMAMRPREETREQWRARVGDLRKRLNKEKKQKASRQTTVAASSSGVIEGQPCALGSCAAFPTTPGSTSQMHATFTGAGGTVSCNASITISNKTKSPRSKHVWFLVALQTTLVPASPNTPDEAVAGACVIMHCDQPNATCPIGQARPVSMYESDLYVSQFSVSAQFSGGYLNSSATTNTYPLYGAIDQYRPFPYNPVTDAAMPWPFRVLDPAGISFSDSFFDNEYDLTAQAATRPLDEYLFFSGGILASAKGATWSG